MISGAGEEWGRPQDQAACQSLVGQQESMMLASQPPATMRAGSLLDDGEVAREPAPGGARQRRAKRHASIAGGAGAAASEMQGMEEETVLGEDERVVRVRKRLPSKRRRRITRHGAAPAASAEQDQPLVGGLSFRHWMRGESGVDESQGCQAKSAPRV